MLNSPKLSFFLLIFSLVIVSSIWGASKKREVVANFPKPLSSLPELPQLVPLYTSDIFKLSFKNQITPISDFLRSIEFSDMPEEYDIWSDTKINPYQVNLVEMKDTVKIDLCGYIPPCVKYVTSEFGLRKWRPHYGIDLKVNKGDSVGCAFDGIIRITRRERGYGYFVLVRHFNGLETLYGHLSKILVNPGDTIKAGNTIGLGGSTGRSTGNHLHFETRYLGNPINPNDIIDFNTHAVKNNIFLLNSHNFDYRKELDKIRFWVIKRGDTLGRIAMRTGVSIARLCSINGIKRTTILRIGRRIRYT